MKIVHKEVLTFTLTSDSGEIYEVNLATNRPHGWCSCPDYQFRQAPRQKHDQHDGPSPERCKHIVMVREHMVERLIQTVIDARKTAAKENVRQAAKNRAAVPEPREPSSHRPPTVSALQQPPSNRPPPRYPPVSGPPTGAGAAKLNRPVPHMPRLGPRKSG